MKVKCTKTMANEINKFFKQNEKFNGYYAKVDKLRDFFEGEKQVIIIIYPYNYYALPHMIDNNDLLQIFKNSDKTYNGFFNALLEAVEK